MSGENIETAEVVEDKQPATERYEMELENVDLHHETMSGAEQVRCSALNAALAIGGRFGIDDRSVDAVLRDAKKFERYIQDGVTADSAAVAAE